MSTKANNKDTNTNVANANANTDTNRRVKRVRRRIKIKKIEDKIKRLIKLLKRRNELAKKANELAVQGGTEIAMVIFSASGKEYCYLVGKKPDPDPVDALAEDLHRAGLEDTKEVMVDQVTSLDANTEKQVDVSKILPGVMDAFTLPVEDLSLSEVDSMLHDLGAFKELLGRSLMKIDALPGTGTGSGSGSC